MVDIGRSAAAHKLVGSRSEFREMRVEISRKVK
jgi:hypothetical protein